MMTTEMNHKKDQQKKIGVLFCGGCNPTYNRESLYWQLQRHYAASIRFEFYEEAGEYDLLLIINGCASECLINETYQSQFIHLDTGDAAIAVQKIDQVI